VTRPATLWGVTTVGGRLAVLAIVLVAACGGPDNTYVSEKGSGLFLRLPPDWTVYPLESGKPASDPTTDADFGVWRVLIDGDHHPDRAHGEELAPGAPVGTVQVVPRVAFSTPLPLAQGALRSLFMPDGSDPLEALDLTDIEYHEIDLGHHWGNRLIATVDRGGVKIRIAQLAFFDRGGKRLHVALIQCTVECFRQHKREIDGVLDSFTLEDR